MLVDDRADLALDPTEIAAKHEGIDLKVRKRVHWTGRGKQSESGLDPPWESKQADKKDHGWQRVHIQVYDVRCESDDFVFVYDLDSKHITRWLIKDYNFEVRSQPRDEGVMEQYRDEMEEAQRKLLVVAPLVRHYLDCLGWS